MNRRNFITHSALALAAGAIVPREFGAETTGGGSSDALYTPAPKPGIVVKPGEFVFAASHLEHDHIEGMSEGLNDAGATLKWVYDEDPAKAAKFQKKFPQVKVARSFDEILGDPQVKLVASAAITSERAGVGERVMKAGKDYFTDKAPFTTMDQLTSARKVVAETGRKYAVNYAERIHNECAMFATDLVARGAIGRVLQVVNLAPHRLNKSSRPAWFFEREKYGGILCDIGSHQFEQFLAYSGATDATVTHSAIANFGNPDHPELEDFGEATLAGNNGASNYVRVDWFTPDGLSTWGDGRTFILGTGGFIELRKYVDLARAKGGDHVYMADEKGERRIEVAGKVGYRFFGEFILDCLNRTEVAMTQAHAFKAAELSLKAQSSARRIVT